MPLPIRPEHVGLKPYGAPQLNVRARLNVNENPYAPPPKVVDAIAAAVLKHHIQSLLGQERIRH